MREALVPVARTCLPPRLKLDLLRGDCPHADEVPRGAFCAC